MTMNTGRLVAVYRRAVLVPIIGLLGLPGMPSIYASEDNLPPSLELTDPQDQIHSLAQYRGQVVLINFWATWCPPCRKEMPDLQSLWGSYQDQEDVVFMIASVDQEQGKVQPYIDANNYSFPVFYAGTAGQAYQVTSIPSTYVIDKTGSIQYVHVGYRPDIKDVLTWEINALRKE